MTGVTQALLPIADKQKIVLFATTVSASGIPERSPWVFRLFITADNDAIAFQKNNFTPALLVFSIFSLHKLFSLHLP
jgi:hypothetical protein